MGILSIILGHFRYLINIQECSKTDRIISMISSFAIIYYNIEMKADMYAINERFSVNLNRALGKGCYGEVYEGYDNQSNKVIAIKHLNKPENFSDEIQTLRDLSKLRHPYIMGFYGYEISEKDVYLFIEYCPNGTLTDMIKKGIDEERVLDLFRQLVQGMCYMNAKTKMHRDLKPDNILIGQQMDVKISDFGLARASDGIDITGQIGTPLYAAPQVYTNFSEAYNINCDVWAGGLILSEMLTGVNPFEHIQTIYELKEEWKKFEKGQKRIQYDSKFHPQWEYITNFMLTYNLKKRPTFHDILELLKKLDDNGSMRLQIRNKKSGIESKMSEHAHKVDNYLNFIEQKYDLLTNLQNVLSDDKFPTLGPFYKKLLVFISMARYVAHMKKLIRSLKYKTIKFPNDEDLVDRNQQDNTVNLLIDKYRNSFEAKYTKFNTQLKEKLIPKIIEEGEKEKKGVVENAWKMVNEASTGSYDIEDSYQEGYLALLDTFKYKPSDETIKKMTIQNQGIYLYILMVGLLDKEINDELFMKKNYVKNKVKEYSHLDEEAMMKELNRLRQMAKLK